MLIWTRRILLLALSLYLILLVIAYFGQRKLIYFPSGHYQPPPAGWTEVQTEDGFLGWHSPAREGLPTLMIFHGNGSAIDSNMHIFRDLQAAGYGVWSVGYPGYPGNSGTPTQANIIAAARQQHKALKEQGVSDIIFYGTSLGSGVAAQLAAELMPELLILDAPFNSIADIAAQQMPLLPTRLLLRDKWESDRALQGLSVPLIWIHGTADQIVHISQGQKLFDGYEGPKSGHIIPGAHHTNTWLNGGREIVLDALRAL